MNRSALNARHLFLCAVGRSGTTILRTSLGLHPSIYYNDRENNIIQDLLSVAQSNCTQPSRKFAMVVEQDTYDQVFARTITDLIWPDQNLRDRPVRFAAINPTGDQLGYLQQVFPNSKILGLVRNGIEVISSRMRYASFSDHEFQSHCQVWNRSESIFDWGQANHDSFRLFRHEWFYDRTRIRRELSSLFEWLEIPDSEKPMENIMAKIRHPTDENKVDFDSMSETARQKYFQSKADRWMDWTPEQLEQFTRSCSPLMKKLGYEMPWLDSDKSS